MANYTSLFDTCLDNINELISTARKISDGSVIFKVSINIELIPDKEKLTQIKLSGSNNNQYSKDTFEGEDNIIEFYVQPDTYNLSFIYANKKFNNIATIDLKAKKDIEINLENACGYLTVICKDVDCKISSSNIVYKLEERRDLSNLNYYKFKIFTFGKEIKLMFTGENIDGEIIRDQETCSPFTTVGENQIYTYNTSNENLLDLFSWEELAKLSDAGIAKNLFSVGDCKKLDSYTFARPRGCYLYKGHSMAEYNPDPQYYYNYTNANYDYYVFILGFDHNAEIEGPGISFGCFKARQKDSNETLKNVAFYDSEQTNYQYFLGYVNSSGYSRPCWERFINKATLNKSSESIKSSMETQTIGDNKKVTFNGKTFTLNVKQPQNYDSEFDIDKFHSGYTYEYDKFQIMCSFDKDLRKQMSIMFKTSCDSNTYYLSYVSTCPEYLTIPSIYEIDGISKTEASYSSQKQYEYFKNNLGKNSLTFHSASNLSIQDIPIWTRSMSGGSYNREADHYEAKFIGTGVSFVKKRIFSTSGLFMIFKIGGKNSYVINNQ